jgi:hypothetical protein
MLTYWHLVFILCYFCGRIQSSDLSLVDTEVQITRTPGSLIVNDRSTTRDIDLPVFPGHTWSADFKNIFQGKPFSIDWNVNGNYFAEGTSIKMTVSPNDIGSTFFIKARRYSIVITGPQIHLVMAPAPKLTSELSESVYAFSGDYIDLSVATSIDDGFTTYQWDIEKVPLLLQTTNNVRVKANVEMDGAKLTVTVVNPAGKVTSSTIIKVLPPRWVIALIVIGGFILLCGIIVGVLFALRSFGYISIKLLRNRGSKSDTINYTRVSATPNDMQEDEDLALTMETD